MFKPWIPAAAALLFAAGVHADSTRRSAPELAPATEKPASAPVVQMTSTIAATVSYPGTLPASPTFNRPSGCASLSGVGTAVAFHEQSFTVDTAGSYTLTVLNTAPAIDTVMVLYQGSFSAASPLTNCIAYNDDTAGLGALSRITQTLATGTTYVLVTTTFGNGETGSFNNEITGPGGISLVGAGPSANLGLTKSAPDGVVNGGTYRYVLAASNAGPDNATGVTVTDTLPAGVSFVSSTCGATAAGQTVTWPIGAFANGGSTSCTLTVSRDSLTCSTVVNTASISGTETDPNPANNTATHSNGGSDLIVDGSFEAPSAPAWTQSSTNYGSPLCDEAGCGTGGGTAGPRTGSQWMWFGGAGALEVGVAEQSVAIPAGATTLSFGYRLGLCAAGAGANDFIRLTVGGTELWRRDASSAECGATAYALASVDISALAGSTQAVRFESTSGTAGTSSNFSIDDVSLPSSPVCVAPPNADLSIAQTLTPVGAQLVGNGVDVALTAANAGPGAASGVTVSTVLPAQLSFVNSTCGATAVGQTVTWAVGALANGASASCTINTSISAGGAISVSSSVSSSTTDPVTTNNAAASSLSGAPVAAARPAVVPSLNAVGLLALVLSLLAVGGLAFGRREH
ncbi:DUF11 domain-containing protein [Aquimonas voraii]|uniref:Conserved repeat domain-containing protein n=1 Tax=Aquimonas voraii TaxID=265719 RepID=A0A1G6W5D8_9GAMM|nr:DUF11 domain-containing protein [Aquimonas voraii]SDD61092.1 conserved repeat domain-containing protein [Aquimonas voraii]